MHKSPTGAGLSGNKITVWDSGGGSVGNGRSSSTANFLAGLVGSLPPLQEIAKMAGVELPEYLGRMTDSGNTNGTAPTTKSG